LDGSARQTTKVNATTPTLPLVALTAGVNARLFVVGTNRPALPLVAFTCAVNGSVYQIADVTFVIEVASSFAYAKNVSEQNVPGTALAAIDAIVTTGNDINVAATKAACPIVVFPTSVKANASTRAVSSVPLPLTVYNAQVALGLNVAVTSALAVPLSAIPVGVTAAEDTDNAVVAGYATLALDALDATVEAEDFEPPAEVVVTGGHYWPDERRRKPRDINAERSEEIRREREQLRRTLEIAAGLIEEVEETAPAAQVSEAKAVVDEVAAALLAQRDTAQYLAEVAAMQKRLDKVIAEIADELIDKMTMTLTDLMEELEEEAA
jgi:hypothetical protein